MSLAEPHDLAGEPADTDDSVCMLEEPPLADTKLLRGSFGRQESIWRGHGEPTIR